MLFVFVCVSDYMSNTVGLINKKKIFNPLGNSQRIQLLNMAILMYIYITNIYATTDIVLN
jgi:hypothetical protein